jgi:hypothetical protein
MDSTQRNIVEDFVGQLTVENADRVRQEFSHGWGDDGVIGLTCAIQALRHQLSGLSSWKRLYAMSYRWLHGNEAKANQTLRHLWHEQSRHPFESIEEFWEMLDERVQEDPSIPTRLQAVAFNLLRPEHRVIPVVGRLQERVRHLGSHFLPPPSGHLQGH